MKSLSALALLALSSSVAAQTVYPKSYVKTLETRTRCTNIADIQTALKFTDYAAGTVYPEYDTSKKAGGGYNTEFSKTNNCYIVFENPEARATPNATIDYNLQSMTAETAAAMNTTGAVYMTHTHDCGVCSTLDQLGVYLDYPDLTTPVRACGEKSFLGGDKATLDCLAGLGFRDACQYIWLYNTLESKKLCALPCLANLNSPNNEPKKGLFETNYCEAFSSDAKSGCKNQINGKLACEDFQWQDGEYRLNPCLQCDECRSGPIFQKFAGRTRRDSGLESAIKRPPSQVVSVTHYYGIPFE